MRKPKIVMRGAAGGNLPFVVFDIAGLTVIFSPVAGFKTAALGVFVKTGSRHEKKSFKGIAHYLEHMVFKGSRKYSYKDITREIEGRGGMLNGFTSQETTAYYSQFLSKNLAITMDILMDMVMFPRLDAAEIEKERGVIREEIKMHNDLPHARVGSLLERILWERHPLGDEIIGTYDTVGRIRKEDLIHFRKHYDVSSRMVIVCVADAREEEVLSLIQDTLRAHRGRKLPQKTSVPASLRSRRIAVEKREIDQTQLCLGFRGPSYRSPDRMAADLINVILGANMSSRLFEEIREKRGLCYDVSTEARKFHDSGAFIIHLGLAARNVPVALKRIVKELRRICIKKVGAGEMERAKDYLLGQFIMGLEKPQGRMFYMADSYIGLHTIFDTQELARQVDRISPEKIRSVSRSIFNTRRLCVSCVTNEQERVRADIVRALRSS